MIEKMEMVKVDTWTLQLQGAEEGKAYYYNPREDLFENKFMHQCGFLHKHECEQTKMNLNLPYVKVEKVTVEVPKQSLVDSSLRPFWD
jgi:hypothetical protein